MTQDLNKIKRSSTSFRRLQVTNYNQLQVGNMCKISVRNIQLHGR